MYYNSVHCNISFSSEKKTPTKTNKPATLMWIYPLITREVRNKNKQMIK